MLSRSLLAAGALLVLAACGGDSDAVSLAGGATSARPEPTGTLIRVPADGGEPALHRTADLAELPWEDAPRLPAVAEVLEAAGDDRVVYLLNRRRQLLGLDVETGRSGEVGSGIVAAAAAPDGGAVAVDTAGAAVRIRRRTPQPLRGIIEGEPVALYPTQRGGVIAALAKGGLAVLGADHPPARVQVPQGPSAATIWGDLVAVGTDSGLVLYTARESDSLAFIATDRPAHAVAFSPSGHRIYVATPDAELLVLDRFGAEPLGTIELPGPAGALRIGREGRWLLARPVTGDSLWVVDLVSGTTLGSTAGLWGDDLPLAAGERVVLRRGDDVVVLALEPGLPRRGIVEDGGADRWALVAWTPAAVRDEAAPALARDEPAGDGDAAPAGDDGETADGAPVYLQVSSSRNPEWASDLVQQMRGAGLPASLLDPAADGEPYRVVLGPYPSREAADEAGRRLGRAYFIIGGNNPASPEPQ